MSTALLPGLQFPRDVRGKHGTTQTAKSVFAAALNLADPAAAHALLAETDWRRRYPQHLVQLNRVQATDGSLALRMAQAALDQAHTSFEFVRDNQALPLAEAMARSAWIAGSGFQTLQLRGPGPAEPVPWALPWQGRELRGDEARALIDRWAADGICEPGHTHGRG